MLPFSFRIRHLPKFNPTHIILLSKCNNEKKKHFKAKNAIMISMQHSITCSNFPQVDFSMTCIHTARMCINQCHHQKENHYQHSYHTHDEYKLASTKQTRCHVIRSLQSSLWILWWCCLFLCLQIAASHCCSHRQYEMVTQS